jgi:hypothetical protein
MNHLYDTDKPSTWAAIVYMGQVCKSIWADHRADVELYREAQLFKPAQPGSDLLFIVICVALLVVLGLGLSAVFLDLWPYLRAGWSSLWASAPPAALAAVFIAPGEDPTSETQVTVGRSPTKASAGEVPGWNKGPLLREGSQDFRRHMHHTQGPAQTQTRTPEAPV